MDVNSRPPAREEAQIPRDVTGLARFARDQVGKWMGRAPWRNLARGIPAMVRYIAQESLQHALQGVFVEPVRTERGLRQ